MNEELLFAAALERSSPAEREGFLQQACGADDALRARLAGLLHAHDHPDTFLHAPTACAAREDYVGATIGPYKLLQQIGEGGMGTVYMAEQTEPVQRKVAVKVIKAGMDTDQVIARFEAERQALAMMDHANIARVLDVGTTQAGRPFFVMELVHGVPITKYCDDNHLTPRQRLELFVPVCQAIQHAHQKGIIHRDIKPSNVMVTLYDGKPVPKVIDFGVAKATEQRLTERTLFTQFGTMVGTLEYMSPEQAEMSALGIDTRSDIFSLGVLLYELLTGSTPLSNKRMKDAAYAEILRMIREEEPPKPSTRLSDSGEALASISAQRHTEPAKLTKLVRGELDWIVMKTLEKDRNSRYESASGFAADVQRYLDDEPVQACPPSAWYRLRKFARRNRAALAFAGLVLLILLAVTGGIGWNVRDRAARQTAAEQEVSLALKEAEQWQEQAKWPEALSAAKRAEGLLAGGGSDELGERVHQLRNDLEMVLRLEEIRFLSSESKDNTFNWENADQAYTQAFANYGIDVLRLPVEEAAARIRARAGVAVPLAIALDDWADARGAKELAGRLALTAVAQAADPDPWRRQVRQADQQKDAKALAALAGSPEVLRQPPTSVLVLANALWFRGLSETRIEVLRQAQRQYPGDFWMNYQLARTLAKMKPLYRDEATSYGRAALAVRPQSSAAHNELGNALHDQGKLDEAIACYRRAIEIDPKFAFAYNNLGSALAKQEKLPEAIAAYRKAIEIDPKLAPAHNGLGALICDNLKDYGQAIECFRNVINLAPHDSEAHFNLGNALSGQKKLDEAIDAYRRAIEIDPKYAATWVGRGCAFSELAQWDKALADFSKAIELNPKYAKAWSKRGVVYLTLGQLHKALTDFSEAINLEPKHATAWSNRGVVYKRLGQMDKALADLSKAIELDSKYATAWNNRGVVYRSLAQWDKALADHSKAIELDPKYATAWSNRGLVYGRLLQWDKALADYSNAVELDPKDASVHNNQAWLLATCPDAKFRDPGRAVKLAKRAVDLSPKEESYVNTLGVAQYRAGDCKAAIETLQKSRELRQGGDSFDWFFLAMAHWQLDQKDEARKWLNQAALWMKNNKPEDEELQRFRAEATELLGIQATPEP